MKYKFKYMYYIYLINNIMDYRCFLTNILYFYILSFITEVINFLYKIQSHFYSICKKNISFYNQIIKVYIYII